LILDAFNYYVIFEKNWVFSYDRRMFYSFCETKDMQIKGM